MQQSRRNILVAATGAIGLIAGCSSDNEPVEGSDHNTTTDRGDPPQTTTTTETSDPTTTEETTESAEAKISIEGSELKKQTDSIGTDAYITGTISNVGDGRSGQISLKGRFYDSDDNLLDSTTENLPYLKPGEVWKCYIPYLDDGKDVASHKLDGKFKKEPVQMKIDGLSITDLSFEKDDYGAAVKGTIVNDLEEDADYLAAVSRFWKDGSVLCGGLDNITDVPAGENWAFESDSSGYGDRASKSTDYDVIPDLSIY